MQCHSRSIEIITYSLKSFSSMGKQNNSSKWHTKTTKEKHVLPVRHCFVVTTNAHSCDVYKSVCLLLLGDTHDHTWFPQNVGVGHSNRCCEVTTSILRLKLPCGKLCLLSLLKNKQSVHIVFKAYAIPHNTAAYLKHCFSSYFLTQMEQRVCV